MASTKRAAPARGGPGSSPLEAEPLNATAASLLGFLLAGPATGFDLVRKAEEIIGDFWNVTRSQVYRELKELAARGFVAQLATGPRDKQPYRITPAGRAAFLAFLARRPGPPIMRFPFVLTAFFGEHVDPSRMASFVEEQRAYHAARLEAYEVFRPRVDPGTWPAESLRMGVLFQKAVLRWIDTLPSELRLGARPAPKGRRRPAPAEVAGGKRRRPRA